MKEYVDSRGWHYRVMPGIVDKSYKARYQVPGNVRWRCVVRLPWRETPEAAQEDLDRMAQEKRWREWQ